MSEVFQVSHAAPQLARPQSAYRTYGLLVLTNLIWGSTWVVGKWLTQAVPAITASALRFVVATAVLGVLVRWQEGQIPPLPRADRRVAVGLGVFGVFVYSLFFLIGLRYTASGRGALIIALNPAVIALAAWWLYQERMTSLKACGIVLALAGCVWVVSHGRPMQLLHGEVGVGDVLIIGCVLAWAVYTFISGVPVGRLRRW